MQDKTATARAVYAESAKRLARSVVEYFDRQYPDVTAAAIARHFQIDTRRVYRYLKDAGRKFAPKPKRQIDMEKVRRAHRLYAHIQNKSEVARIMGMSRSRITEYLKMEV